MKDDVEQFNQNLGTMSWRKTGLAIWVANSAEGAQPAGIVTERRRGLFTVISVSGTDLGTHSTLADAQKTLDRHHNGLTEKPQ